jgi:hypothetical protein
MRTGLQPTDIEANFRNSPVPVRFIDVCSSSTKLPSAHCASVANVACRDVDILGNKTVSFNHIL